MNEARRLGTCTDTLTRREKNDSLALSSTATTYVGFSVLPRSINIRGGSRILEKGGSDKYIHNWGRVREGDFPLP